MSQEELENTCRQIVKHSDRTMVVYSEGNLHPAKIGPNMVSSQHVSSNPMYGIGYSDCNGVVLLDHVVAGLSHYDLSSGDPRDYLDLLVAHLKRASLEKGGFKAVPVGGDEDHYRRILHYLRENDIPIIQGLCRPGLKKLFVDPSTRTVIVQSPAFGFRRLAGSY